MKFLIFVLLIFLSGISFAQNSWFKHLAGFHARSSLIKDDTILTTGMNFTIKSFGYKFNVFMSWNKLNMDSLGLLNINLDSFEKDSTRTTLLSSNYAGSILTKNGSLQFLRLSDGKRKDRTFLMNFEGFYSHKSNIEEFTIDTFTSSIDDILPHLTGNIVIVRYAIIEKPLESSINTIIYKGKINGRTKIKEYKDTKNEKYKTANLLVNQNSNKSFFFKFTKMWDYHGSPEQWEEYIVKMDTLGNELWRIQPNNRYDINPTGMQMVQKPNGNLLVSWCDEYYRPYMDPNGPSQLSQLNRNCTLWFAEIDSSGKILWRKNIKSFLKYKLNRDSTHVVTHVKAIPVKNGIVWVGNYELYYFHNYVLKTDFDGNPIWFREYELYPTNKSKSQFFPYDITSARDFGLIITGEYRSAKGNIFPEGCQKATIIKVDSFGCLEPNCQLNDSIPKEDSSSTKIQNVSIPICKIFPNPATTELKIDFKNPGKFLIKIYNQSGELILDLNESKSITLETQNFPSGLYLIYIQSGNGEIFTKKIIIKH